MPAENIVEVHHLKKSVGQGEHELSILTGVELVVKRGETIALVGESGSGKSTLLAILAGLDDGSSGEVRLVGQPLHNMDEEARAKLRAKHVGFVFQSFMLIPTLNALENVELPALLRGESSAESRNGAKALLEQDCRILIPVDDIDFLTAKLIYDSIYSGTIHTYTCSYRVYVWII